MGRSWCGRRGSCSRSCDRLSVGPPAPPRRAATPMSTPNADLHERAISIARHLDLDALDDAAVRTLVREHGLDLATAVLYDRTRRCVRHADLAARLQTATATSLADGLVVGVVPGAF